MQLSVRRMGFGQAAATLLLLGTVCGSAVAEPVFEERFDGFADGERPSSVVEVRATPWRRGEVVGKRYAINAGGNAHRLVMPQVSDFELTFTAEPHQRAKYAPILVICFRQSRGRGYRLHHWFGPTWGRVDFHHWDDAAQPPIRTRLESTNSPKISLPQPRPIRWRLAASGNTFSLHRNGGKIWEYTDTDRPTLEPGAITFDISLGTKDPTAPIYFDDVRVDSSDPGVAERFRRVLYCHKQIPGDIVAAHVNIFHKVLVHEVLDTGLDQIWTDVPRGRMFRVTASVDFPDMSEGEGRKMAAKSPYVRIETTDGAAVLEQRIFDGILGSTWPGHHSAPAQILRLHAEHDSLPPDGVQVRTAAVADATGPQQAVACLRALPADFHITAGWEYWLDNDHIHVAGPVEATWTRDGERVYAGRPIRPSELTFELVSPPSEGILARIRKDNRYYQNCVAFQRCNHYFLEGEPVAFSVNCSAGIDARLDAQAQWQLADGYMRPLKEPGTVTLDAPESSLWPRADRKLTWQTRPFVLEVAKPGVYWLQLTIGERTKRYAFSIVPREQRPGNTAATACGLPRMDGNFYPMQPWLKDIHHYVSGAAGSRDEDWYEAVHAYNMLAIERGGQTAEVIGKVEGLWNPGLKGAKLPKFPRFPDKRLWRRMAAKPESTKAFLASDYYNEHPDDTVLRDPEADEMQRWQTLTRHHLKGWADYWSELWADRDVAVREAIDAVNPDLVTGSYGPRLISSFHYGNLYCGKYYGWDWRRRVGRPHLINTWQVETYAREFGRASMSYTPSLALAKMGLPEIDYKWEIYGSVGGVEDSRLAFGRPPHGLSVPNRDAVANHSVELSLAPWYFADGFEAAGGTHLAPWVGHFTQEQVFGLIDGMRVFHEAEAVRPVRSPAFVRSYEAAERDPSWREQSINNSAAEAPAYAYGQARMAGLAGGFFVDIADVAALDPGHTDLLVLPSMRGATAAQTAAIRAQHEHGVALLCFDDCTGLEDLFGVRRLPAVREIAGVRPDDAPDVLADVPAAALRERVRHRDTIWYELDAATALLSGVDADGTRVAPVLSIRQREGGAGAVFYALGATRVGRRNKRLDSTNHEGEVTSDLIRHALRAAMRAVARPVVSVRGPASVLAFVRGDDSLYVVVLESSFPEPRPGGTPVDVLLTVHCGTPADVSFTCDRTLLDMQPEPGKRTVKLQLRPDEVVPMVVSTGDDG